MSWTSEFLTRIFVLVIVLVMYNIFGFEPILVSILTMMLMKIDDMRWNK